MASSRLLPRTAPKAELPGLGMQRVNRMAFHKFCVNEGYICIGLVILAACPDLMHDWIFLGTVAAMLHTAGTGRHLVLYMVANKVLNMCSNLFGSLKIFSCPTPHLGVYPGLRYCGSRKNRHISFGTSPGGKAFLHLP